MSERRPQDDRWYEEEEPQPKPWWKTRRAFIFAIAVIGAIVFIFTRGGTQVSPETQKTAASIGVIAPYSPPEPPPKAPPEEKIPDAPKITLPAVGPPINLLNPPTPGHTERAAPSYPAMMSYAVPAAPKPPPPPPGDPANPPETGIKFATATLPGSRASPQIDDTYILMPGLLPCVLRTAIDSNLPGPLQCHTPGPVYSRKGVVLMEAGTEVMGRYESLTRNGSMRLHATSMFAVTPNGIWVKFPETPFADDLGRTGLSGTVDNRIPERFGGAVILDISHALLGIVQAMVAKSGNTYLSFNGTEGLASQILQSEINKPPIFTKSQGSTIALWITEPIDFSHSYRAMARQ